MGVKELTLEPGGLLLPQYQSAASIGYVLEGEKGLLAVLTTAWKRD